jgi:MFS family permease
MDLSLAYQLMSILNGLSVLGRLAPGYAADKLGRFNIMILTTAMSTVLTLGLWVSCAQSQAAIVSYAALFGLSSGSAISLTPVCVAQITRTEDFGKRFGTTYTMVGLGVLVSIPIAGRLVEVQPSDGVGGYRALILFCGLMQAVAFLCFVLARGLRTQWRVRVLY